MEGKTALHPLFASLDSQTFSPEMPGQALPGFTLKGRKPLFSTALRGFPLALES